LITIIWIVSSVASIPIAISTKFISTYHRKQGKLVEICFISLREKWQLGFLFFTFIIFYLVPCVILFTFYGKIVCVIRNRNASPIDCDDIDVFQRKNSVKFESNAQAKTKKIKKDSDSLEFLDDLVIQNKEVAFQKRSSRKSISLPRIKHNQIITLLIIMMLLMLLSMLPYRVFSIWAVLATKDDLKKLGIINYFNLLIFCRVTFYINSSMSNYTFIT